MPDTTSSSAARGRAEVPPAQGRLVSERRLGSLGGGVAVLAGPKKPVVEAAVWNFLRGLLGNPAAVIDYVREA